MADYVSFSRLESYTKCPEYFNHKYIQKTEGKKTSLKALLLGDLVHQCFERIIELSISEENSNKEIDNKEVFKEILPYWLVENNLSINHEDALTICFSYGEIIQRCSESYIKSDRIRNKDGSVLKDVFKYPSKDLNNEINLLGGELNRLRLNINTLMGQLYPEWVSNPFCDFLAEAASIVLNFKLPNWHKKTVGIEYPISTNENNIIKFTENYNLNGYIDWIVRTNKELIIIDHKTSKKKLTPQDVMYHPQLNVYGYVIKELLGEYPTALCIHHARSNTYILAEFVLEIAESIVQHYKDICFNIDKQKEGGLKYIKRLPTDYNSPCVSKDYITGTINQQCEYLGSCWSNYKRINNLED